MKLQLIRDTERLEFKTLDFDDLIIFYKRITASNYYAIVRANTGKADMVDLDAAKNDILRKYILDWTGVTDENGKEIPFEPELVLSLPENIQEELKAVIRFGGGEQVIKKSKIMPKP